MNRRKFTGLLSIGALSASATRSFAESTASNPIDIPDMIMGSEDAPITIIEYASFTCIHCARFHKNIFPSLRKNYIETNKVKFIYREVYFDAPGVWAAQIARCRNNEKYFGISDLLYSRRDEWFTNDNTVTAQNLFKIGNIAGLKKAEIQTCLYNKEFQEALIARYQETSKEHNVKSTPTLILNDQNIGTVSSYTELAALIDEAMP
jgi:protein-disulfide isomerase